MAEKTKIAWATSTWNPWIGCSKVASGCVNCYAEADFAIRRKRVVWGPHGTRVKTSDAYWRKPIKWNREAGTLEHLGGGNRPRVFPSLCDVFEEWGGVIQGTSISTFNDVRRDFFSLIDATPNLDWLLLTKRPENILRMWPTVAGRPYVAESGSMNDYQLNRRDNVWLIYSASDQESLEQGVYQLLRYRDLVPVLGLSLEPLLGPIDLSGLMDPIGIDYVENIPACKTGGSELSWVIVGGESGPNARPCNVRWIRDIVSQCQQAGVPVFVKQLGSRAIYLGEGNQPQEMWPHFSDSKGGDLSEFPRDLRVREFPQ